MTATPEAAPRAGGDAAGDPATDALFLALLERDLAANPQRAAPLDAGLLKRLQTLTGEVKTDLESMLPGRRETGSR